MAAPLERALLSSGLVQLAVMALAALAVGGGVYVFAMPLLGGERKTAKRLESASMGSRKARSALQQQPLQMRKKQVQDTIRDLEAKQKAQQRISLRKKLMRAGLDISPRIYWILSAVIGLIGGVIVLFMGSPPWVALLATFALGVGLPRFFLKRITAKRQAKFLHEFANAIDIIVRGIKSGLPLNDCLQIIASESPEPVRSEFIDLVEQQKVGMPLQRSFERMYDRMPLQEVSFFAIVVAIQAQTGGNLAEALSNLSQVLRDRYRLQAKVKSFSAEAKASAMILGSLPPLVMIFVYTFNPEYINLLFDEKLGNIMLMAAGIWMAFGIFVMRKMINFEY
jgi:tight adherence protein B